MQINVVPQETCPRCGGGDEFYNRPKVGHEDGTWSWRCYNPDCDLRYWNPDWPGYEVDELSPEEDERLRTEIQEWMKGSTFVTQPDGSSQMRTPHGLSLEEWRKDQK